ncbi:hypothetical protein C9374_006591 [Naegleria lovaniensis]|uniref:Protein kinase domain-containing protein n=1 Tax=Naegleria lovaniensis TaxID=51637 RepID=A0AA88GL21_NAELO|nr:uncharacterized protein C9374_006591 [Naegleria lovaniensis]KAG2379474.1 hypothetical protein C9374_006591 [Naegleria lovaniensis]
MLNNDNSHCISVCLKVSSVETDRVSIIISSDITFDQLMKEIKDAFQDTIPSSSKTRIKYFNVYTGFKSSILNDKTLQPFFKQLCDSNVENEKKELVFEVTTFDDGSKSLINTSFEESGLSSNNATFSQKVELFSQYSNSHSLTKRYDPIYIVDTEEKPLSLYEKNQAEEYLKEKYSSLNFICSGSFGSVYSVVRKDNNEQRAIKIMKVDDHEQPLQEFSKMKKLSHHENIVKCFDIFVAGSTRVIVIEMELMSGSLYDIVIQKGIKLPENMILEILRQLCNALLVIQEQNIIHRDIKPQNILLRKFDLDKNEIVIGLGDFGLAKNSSSIKSSSLAGTANYIAPELVQNNNNSPPFSFASDMFALGVTLYQLMSLEKHVVSWSSLLMAHNINPNFIQQQIKVNMKGIYSDSLVKIVESMLKFLPEQRITVSKILQKLSTTENQSLESQTFELSKMTQDLAHQGYAEAQNNLGHMYEHGIGVPQNYSKALEWYQKSANQGDAKAQYNLGCMYRNGRGVVQDYSKAFEWYQKSANQGDADAQYYLGWMYYRGEGISQDYSKAFQWFQQAANQGNAQGQHSLAWMYHNGMGVPNNFSKAKKLYLKAANQGIAIAKTHIGWMYYHGKGTPQDYSKAFEWFQQAANQGEAHAQYYLGFMYEMGQGVPEDCSKALEWYQKSANQGDSEAQNKLGWMYYHGHGVPQDYSKAFEWFQKAANQGNAHAEHSLGHV